jgi:hypothetical protein
VSTLSNNAIQIDRRLERAAGSAHLELVRHRWHWTLDESNPRRVPIRAYAREIGRSQRTLQGQVKGYAAWLAADGADAVTLNGYIERALMSAEKAAVVETVAKANGVEFRTARQKFPQDVKRVQAAVREKVEKDPETDPAEYAEKIAKTIAVNRQVEKETRERHRASKSRTYIEISGLLSKARRAVNDALVVARDGELDPETTEFVVDALDRLEAATGLLRLAVAGSADIDWDREMIKMGGDLS